MTIILTAYSGAESALQLITVLIIFVIVLFVAAYTARYVGQYQKLQGLNRNLEVIETLRITNNKYLQIVRAANKYIVIAVGKDEISMLTEIDESELLYANADNSGIKSSFSDLIKKASDKVGKKKSEE